MPKVSTQSWSSIRGWSSSVFGVFSNYFTTIASTKARTVEYQDIFDGCNEKHIWCFANMFMQHGKAKTDISNTGPTDTDASMFFKMMKNCKLFEIENENYLYKEVIKCRDKLHHSANSRIAQKETETHLKTMMKLLQKFEYLETCQGAISNIETMLQETVVSMTVKTETLRKLSKEAFEWKKASLAVDEKLTTTSGFGSEETKGLLKDATEALDELQDHSTMEKVFQGLKSREDYKEENKMLLDKNQEDHERNEESGDLMDTQDMTSGHCDEITEERIKTYSKILASANLDRQLCADIKRPLEKIVHKVAEKDEDVKKKVEEVISQVTETENSLTNEKKNTDGEEQPLSCKLFEGINSSMQLGEVCKLKVSDKFNRSNFLTCCRISSDEIMAADRINKRVYKLNNQYKFISSLILDDWPYDVCHIAGQRLVALLFIGKIAFMTTDNMTLKSIDIEHRCSGMIYHSNQLYMIDTNSVYIYDLDGKFQSVLYKSTSLKTEFRHIAISEKSQCIYLTCLHLGLITIGMSGEHVGIYSDPALKDVWGVCLDLDGNVLICGTTYQDILKISSDGSIKIDIIAKKTDEEDLEGKVVVLFLDKQTGLLLTTGSSGSVNVLKYSENTENSIF